MIDLSQEAAASVAVAREIDGSLFIACRDNPQGEDNPLSNLTPREYEVLLLAAQAITHQSTADITGMKVPTVRTHLTNIYDKLGVREKPEAASFIPMDEQRLRSVPLTRTKDAGGTIAPVLARVQSEIFELLGAGYSNERIAAMRESSDSTIRTHRQAIVEKLNLSSGTEKQDIELRRVAGAMRNLKQYAAVAADAATTIQPQVKEILATLDGQEQRVRPSLAKAVAALLIRQPENQAMMQAELTQPIVRELIKHEVAHYVKQKRRRAKAAGGLGL